MRIALDHRRRVPQAPGWALAIVVAWFSGVAAVALLARLHGTPMVPCHFRSVTGLPCATCGTTRAGLAVLDGRVVDALLLNPMVVLFGAMLVTILGVRVATARQTILQANRKERTVLWIVASLIFMANWAYVIAIHID